MSMKTGLKVCIHSNPGKAPVAPTKDSIAGSAQQGQNNAATIPKYQALFSVAIVQIYCILINAMGTKWFTNQPFPSAKA